mmetsp:Transcript_23095/g.37997  ORF Transcript_23095/g.37997 Transcript_23095/m.37997 type:complete len:500 (+) Transcript_23095:119-1618(+)|eukprot:CAMPEP_0184658996 /NCGR_PEP_ID=MMETSP0308-20130426/27706_1 /TAXON_ID=38269 /ORGANISM="Gloeochaete witrockiana, Strain SAG 46.84" /LENGTH=499 /DNA_ID=CAMNT_0027098429 /DNA_START=58 /DNA_END=1557 /DNA_ORIENTATION=+
MLVLNVSRSSVILSSRSAPLSVLRSLRRGYATSEVDVAIIGGGPGGYVAAIKASQLGLNAACVEKRGSLGGTCLNVGCIPSKALLNSSHHYSDAKKNFPKMGIKISGLELDLPTLMKQKDGAVSGLTKGIEGLFKKNKVAYHKGTGRITGANEVTVDCLDGTQDVIKAKNIVIATGSDSAKLPTVPVDEKRIVSSTGALSFPEVPKHLIVIGGGVIGLELGSVWSRLGAEVTVIEFLDNICPGMDLEISKTFHRILQKQGLKFKMGTKVLKAEYKDDQTVALTVQPSKGGPEETIEGDYVLVAIGRAPFSDKLGAKDAGVEFDERGRIKVDKHFRTSVPSIFAIGDVIAGPMLAHKAEEEGVAVAEILTGKEGHVNYNAVPAVVYTWPEVASVGKTEEELKKAGIKYKVGKFPFMANSRARTVDDFEGMVKFLADAETDKVLGIHIVGPNAGELIAEGGLAIEYGASAEDIGRTCHAHPTLSEAFKEAALAAWTKPIHM